MGFPGYVDLQFNVGLTFRYVYLKNSFIHLRAGLTADKRLILRAGITVVLAIITERRK